MEKGVSASPDLNFTQEMAGSVGTVSVSHGLAAPAICDILLNAIQYYQLIKRSVTSTTTWRFLLSSMLKVLTKIGFQLFCVNQINDHLKNLKEYEGESSYKSLADNVLATVTGHKEGQGRLRGRCLLISSTEYKSSSYARAKLRKMNEQQKTNEEKMLSKFSDMVDQRVREMIPDIVAAIKRANVQGTSVTQSHGHLASTSEVGNKQPKPTSCEYLDDTPMELIGWTGDVVGKGKVARLGGSLCHGIKIDFNVEEKVSLALVMNPDEPVYKANSFVETLGDVNKNGYLIWPKMFLKYNP